jgi:hypothetical protein
MPVDDDELPKVLTQCFWFANRVLKHAAGADPMPVLREIAEGSLTLRDSNAELLARFPAVMGDNDKRAAAEKLVETIAKVDKTFARMVLVGTGEMHAG